jgi:hypothetical protein
MIVSVVRGIEQIIPLTQGVHRECTADTNRRISITVFSGLTLG